MDGKGVQGYTADLCVGVEGEVLMKVDTVKYEITFIHTSKSNVAYTYPLNQQHWKSKDLYVYVSMYDKGDSL